MAEKIVYHFCNINTFYSIISNQTLRLSDITKSNDQLEITWAISIIRKVFEKKYAELEEWVKTEITKEKYMDRIDEKVALYFEQDGLKNKFFVICFSGKESGDLLSQWRGYGDDGRGISIGLSEHMLKKIGDSVQLYEGQDRCILYNKVIYDQKEQEKRMEKIVGHFLDKLKDIDQDNGLGINNEFESILLKCFPRLYQEAIFMKNPFFQEENESRLVIYEGGQGEKIEKNGLDISDKCYYNRNNQLVGYYDISLKQIQQKRILKLILGPKCKNDRATLSSFLKDNGFDLEEKNIFYSKGSYL